MQPRKDGIPGAQGFMQPEGHGGRCAMGEQWTAPGGVFDHGTLEEDGPETWEALTSPREETGRRRAEDTSPTRSVSAGVDGDLIPRDSGVRHRTWIWFPVKLTGCFWFPPLAAR